MLILGCLTGAGVAAALIWFASHRGGFRSPMVTCRECGCDYAGCERCPNCARVAARSLGC